MGNWNRRYIPRKKYSNYYQEPPPSPPTAHHTQSYPSGVQNSCVPSWEIAFCKSMGVPWRKVVTSKKFIYSHPTVFEWNDSAGEEAFCSAKKRYWAEINGLPCDNPLPGPDIYIDEIDWNSYIDSKLMLELDREYFNPDTGRKNEKVDTAEKDVSCCSSVRNDKNACDGNDPWESSVVRGIEDGKCTAQNWGQWETPTKLKTFDNPWEQSRPQAGNSLKNNAWRGSGDSSWGWNQGQKYVGDCPDVHNSHCNLWNQGSQPVESMRTANGWGHAEYNSWSTANCRTYGFESWCPVNRNNNWGNNCVAGNAPPNDRRRGDWTNKSQGWKQPRPVNEATYLDFREQSRGGRGPYGDCRKRHGAQQLAPKYKSPRFQANDYGTAYRWQR